MGILILDTVAYNLFHSDLLVKFHKGLQLDE